MREHIMELIDRARHGTDAGRDRGFARDLPGFDRLAADAIRLARLAAAAHAAEAARSAPASESEKEADLIGEQVR